MNRVVEKGKTLLVNGPASVTINSGKVEVFGSIMNVAGRVVIREGKRLPFEVCETANFEISSGEGASVEEASGSTIPESWFKSVQELLRLHSKSTIALVIGACDAGKSSFCTYLANRLLSEKKKISILDGDLGQSDVGPPSTIAYARVAKPVTDLFNLHAENAFFIGETSPRDVTGKVVQALSFLRKEALANEPDFLLINTDGWIEGECAIDYKTNLTKELNPNVVFYVQQKNELNSMLGVEHDVKKVVVESPSALRQRDSEERKALRELGYKKYMRGPKVQSFSLSWVKVEGNESFILNKSHINARYAKKIYDLLEMKPLHMAESSGRLAVIIGRRRWIDSDKVEKIEKLTKKKVLITRKGDEEGLLAAMYNQERRFLGIGVLQEIDYTRKTVKVCTPVSVEIAVLVLGRIKLDRNMKEVPVAEENHTDFACFKHPL